MSFLIALACAIILVELYYIGKEYASVKKLGLESQAIMTLKQKINQLQVDNEALTKAIDEQKRQIEGINLLWSKSLKESSQLKLELNIAHTQLKYLAEKVVKNGKTANLVKDSAEEGPVFWAQNRSGYSIVDEVPNRVHISTDRRNLSDKITSNYL